MKNASSHKSPKPSKGKRLGWPSLKEGLTVDLPKNAVRGRELTADEIRLRRKQAGGKSSPLVP